MIKISEFKTPFEVKTDWISLYSSSKLSYCQSYYWHEEIFKFHRGKLLLHKASLIYRYYEIFDNGVLVLITPIAIKLNESVASIIGDSAPNDYYNFIAKDLSLISYEKYLPALFSFLKEKHNIHSFMIHDSNMLIKDIPGSTCVCSQAFSVQIKTDWNTPEEWFQKLSKSARQNMRTSFNRAKSDGVILLFEEFHPVISKSFTKQLYRFHEKRVSERYIKKRFGSVIISKIIHFLSVTFRPGHCKDKMLTKVLQHSNIDYRLYVLSINGCISAYYLGFLSENKRTISFFRVCIDEKFKRYSPGMMLFYDIVQKSGHEFDVFDFTIGGENYKYVLGCSNVDLFNYQFSF
jgi:hypothetical protein